MMGGQWRLVILAAYMLGSVGLLLSFGLPDDFLDIGFYIFVLALMAAPVALLCVWPTHAKVNGVAAIVIGGVGLFMIVDTMYFQPPDGQSALIFLFVPVMQVMAVAIFGAVFAAILSIARKWDGAGP
jgi:hypothetical protein